MAFSTAVRRTRTTIRAVSAVALAMMAGTAIAATAPPAAKPVPVATEVVRGMSGAPDAQMTRPAHPDACPRGAHLSGRQLRQRHAFAEREHASHPAQHGDARLVLQQVSQARGRRQSAVLDCARQSERAAAGDPDFRADDPLRSEDQLLAAKLKAAGVDVNYKNFESVTHEFFGMGAVLDKAKDAVNLVGSDLKKSFGAAR